MPDKPSGEPERMMVAFHFGTRNSLVLYASGPYCEQDVEDVGPTDVLQEHLTDTSTPDHGVWVWEGYPTLQFSGDGDYGGSEYDYTDYSNGDFREPTDAEWKALREGESPWPSRHPREERAASLCLKCDGQGVTQTGSCTCGGIDIGVGIMHEPGCGEEVCSCCGGKVVIP